MEVPNRSKTGRATKALPGLYRRKGRKKPGRKGKEPTDGLTQWLKDQIFGTECLNGGKPQITMDGSLNEPTKEIRVSLPTK